MIPLLETLATHLTEEIYQNTVPGLQEGVSCPRGGVGSLVLLLMQELVIHRIWFKAARRSKPDAGHVRLLPVFFDALAMSRLIECVVFRGAYRPLYPGDPVLFLDFLDDRGTQGGGRLCLFVCLFIVVGLGRASSLWYLST